MINQVITTKPKRANREYILVTKCFQKFIFSGCEDEFIHALKFVSDAI